MSSVVLSATVFTVSPKPNGTVSWKPNDTVWSVQTAQCYYSDVEAKRHSVMKAERHSAAGPNGSATMATGGVSGWRCRQVLCVAATDLRCQCGRHRQGGRKGRSLTSGGRSQGRSHAGHVHRRNVCVHSQSASLCVEPTLPRVLTEIWKTGIQTRTRTPHSHVRSVSVRWHLKMVKCPWNQNCWRGSHPATLDPQLQASGQCH
jgi:hypothetical protein